MPETGVESAQTRTDYAKLMRLFADHPSSQPRGPLTKAWMDPLAQEEALFYVVEGKVRDTYRGHLISSVDAQSDIGSEIPPGLLQTYWRTSLQKLLSRDSSEWPSSYPEPQSVEAESNDDPSIIDEIAEEWTSDRLADQLLTLDARNDWARMRELILLAEDTNFSQEQSAQLGPRLLEFAIQYRVSNDPQDGPIVWSAIRTGASMLRPNDAERLLPLLEPGHSIETSVVAIKMLGRIFEAQPPARPDQHMDLARTVRGIAEALLNRFAIASSQSAAMAQLAVYALAAMASKETLHIVRAVREIGVLWFTQQTARELDELRSYWDSRSTPVATKVLELLERATQELRTT